MPCWNLGFRLGALYDWNEVKSTVLPIVGIAWKNPGVSSLGTVIKSGTHREKSVLF